MWNKLIDVNIHRRDNANIARGTCLERVFFKGKKLRLLSRCVCGVCARRERLLPCGSSSLSVPQLMLSASREGVHWAVLPLR